MADKISPPKLTKNNLSLSQTTPIFPPSAQGNRSKLSSRKSWERGQRGNSTPAPFLVRLWGTLGTRLSNLLTGFLSCPMTSNRTEAHFLRGSGRLLNNNKIFPHFSGFTVSERHQAGKLPQVPIPANSGKTKQKQKQEVPVWGSLVTAI